MPTIPLSLPMLAGIALLSAIPGVCFVPRAGESRGRHVRVALALVLGSLAGWLAGSSALASGLPVAATVLALLSAMVVFAEGVAGRGWPLAGAFSGTVFLAAVALDLVDRTGEKVPWTLWLILFGTAVAVAFIAQLAWRRVWSVLSRPSGTDSASRSEGDHSSSIG